MSEQDSSVERIKKLLSARDAHSETHARRKLHNTNIADVRGDWTRDEFTALPSEERNIQGDQTILETLQRGRIPDQDPLAEAMLQTEINPRVSEARAKRRLTSRFIRTLFIASAAFFILTGSLAAYFLLFSGRQVSCDHITLDVRGPASIPSGKELLLSVSVLNQNIVPIEGAEIVFEYPEGTRSAQNTTIPLPSQREQVGTIEPGERVRTSGRAVLYGKEQTEHEILTSVEFTIKDSNASFRCEVPYRVALATAPVSVTVQGLEEISSGQELELTVEVRANSQEMVRNVRLVATYPFGFDFLSADPKPTTAESVWDIGDVTVDTVRTIKIRGKVTGYGTENRSVDFAIGEASSVDNGQLSVILQTVEHPFLLTKPFLETTLTLDESTEGDYNIPLGTSIRGRLDWTNTQQEALHDVEVEARLPGVIIDRRSVKVEEGFFRSVDSTILWTPQTNEELRTIEPGEKGSLSFIFKTIPPIEGTSIANPSLNLGFDVHARRIADNVPVEQSLTGQAQRTINFISDVSADSFALFGSGPFTNTGPHPPRVDEETSYTITWRVKNTTNLISNSTMVGELPVNVTWLGMYAPSSEKITFNPVTRKVTWSIDSIPPGTGHQTAPREVSFQIAVTPSIAQAGDVIPLLRESEFSGVDSFTGTVVKRTSKEVTTDLRNDPFFPDDDGSVRE